MDEILCVMVTCSNEYIVQDQIESILWGIKHPINIIVVNDGNKNFSFKDKNIYVIKPKGKIHHASKVGFKANEGLAWAIKNELPFKFAMIMDDDALILGKGLENFAFDIFKNKKIGMIAVKDDTKANSAYSNVNKIKNYNRFIYEWTGQKDFEIPKEFAFYAVNFQSYELIKTFYQNGILESEKEIWPYPCETFQTIFTKIFGFKIHYHGQYPNDLLPPLYVMHHGSVRPEDPRKISNKFLVHHSIRQIKNVKESLIRSYYKKIRKLKHL